MYSVVQLMPSRASFTFLDTLYFGALISPTDPLTILAIFSEKNVDVNLYALVFGESVLSMKSNSIWWLNIYMILLDDAVAIVLSGAIQNYAEYYSKTGDFESHAFFHAVKNFFFVFCFSLVIGTVMGEF